MICYALLGCGECVYCLRGENIYCQNNKFIEGGFSEYQLCSEKSLLPLPAQFDFTEGSMLSDAIGVPLRGIKRIGSNLGCTAAVWGMGPLGLLQVMFLKYSGVGNVIALDPVKERLETAKQLGADNIINPACTDTIKEIQKLTGGAGADSGFSYVRQPAGQETAFKSLRMGGTLVTYTGIDGSYCLPEWQERNMIWSFYFNKKEYYENLDFISRHKINLKKVISHVFGLDKINTAFSMRFDHPAETMKIVISMT